VFLFLEIAFIILMALALSASYGLNDASRGVRTGGWRIEPILLTGSKLPDTLDSFMIGQSYLSGPYGLVGENANAYLLIDWEVVDNTYLPYHPGLYVVPRSENLFLLPVK
jgi:hypothetical protein